MQGTSTLPWASSEIPMVRVSGLVRVPGLEGSGGQRSPPVLWYNSISLYGSFLFRTFISNFDNKKIILIHITFCTIATGSTAPNTGLDLNYFH